MLQDMEQATAIDQNHIQHIRALLLANPQWNRSHLSIELCKFWGWQSPAGQYKDMARRSLSELAVADEQCYFNFAVELANDPGRIARLRQTLRASMAASPLTDEPRFVREVEEAYREMWRDWCAT
jgi:hypothetical protein